MKKIELEDYEINHIKDMINEHYEEVKKYKDNKFLYPNFNEVNTYFKELLQKLN